MSEEKAKYDPIPGIIPYNPVAWEGIKVPRFRDAERCWKFMRKNGFHRLPADSERALLKDVDLAIRYAARINSRLPIEFENMIREAGPDKSWEYVNRVIGVPIEEFEETLAKKPLLLVNYAFYIVKGRLPEHLEDKMIGDPFACFEYSWQILDGQLPENLHNYMFCAALDKDNFARKYRGGRSKLNESVEYDPDYLDSDTYFEFIKWQRKNLCRQIQHYSNIYGVDPSRSVGDLLYELEHGR